MLKNKISLIAVLLIIFPVIYGSLSAQGKKSTSAKHSQKNSSDQETTEDFFDDAEFFFDRGDFHEALYDFKKVFETDTTNANISYRIGMCYLNIPGEEPKAIPYFEKATKKISTKYKKSTFEEKRAPLFMLFYLGNAYRIDNKIDKALSVYKKFRNNPYFDGNYNADMVDDEISACERAKVIADNPIEIKFTKLGPPINDANSNSKAVINRDETVLVYLSSLKFYDAIFISRKVNGEWGDPDNISPQVGSDGDCEPTCLSSDGNDLYMVKKQKNNYDIYVSHYKDGIWSPMVALNKNINSSRMETHASITDDGKTLYFSSDRRGGYGKLDIYKSQLQANGEWGYADNLGENVNTADNETDPFICEDGKTLYFSSEGHLNMGGYDIFTVELMNNNKWEKPVNVGYPLNTTGNDLFYLPLKNGEIGYSCLIRPDENGKQSIYRIENITVQNRKNKAYYENFRQRKVVLKDRQTNDILGILYFDQKTDSLKIKDSNQKIDVKVIE
jgi:tetratricopeptide (TPR) repeat protein